MAARLLWTTIVGLISSQVAAAQNTEIVVEGKRDRKQEIREFVRALTPSKIAYGQIARYEEKICPAAIGLGGSDRRIANRLRAVAREAKIGLAPESCAPNALLIVTDDKVSFIDALRKEYPAYFYNALGEPVKIPQDSGPATAWHIEGMLDYNGTPASISKTAGGGKYYVVTGLFNSRITPNSRPHFIAGVVVIKRSALAGLTETQIADYAAMRLYGRTDPARLPAKSPPSILKAVETPMGGAVPMTLTAWDLAFLKGLYTSEPLQYATQHRASIGRKVGKALAQDGKVSR